MSKIAMVCGMLSEAAIWNNQPGSVVIQGRNSDQDLEADLEAVIAAGGIRGVMSFGLAGGLAPHIPGGCVVVGSYVTNGARSVACNVPWAEAIYDALSESDFTIPWRRGVFAYSTGVVASSAAKAAMRSATWADAVDMETFIAGKVAARHGLPFVILRSISDPATLSDPAAAMVAMKPSGGIDVGAVIGSLGKDPGQIGSLMELGSDAALAESNLAAALLQIGVDYALPERNA